MPAPDPTAGLSTPQGPKPDRAGKPVPEGIAAVLVLVRILLEYGRHLAATLEHRAAARSFSLIAQFFGTARVPFILARLSRGILRAMALERVLLARAARGRDLVVFQPRFRAEPSAQPPAPQPAAEQKPPKPRPVRPELPEFPTLEQLEAEIRRRPIGHAMADICRDLGISPSLCNGRFWAALYCAIDWYRGNFAQYYKEIRGRVVEFAAEWDRDGTRALDYPEQTGDGIRRILGFFIGEEPVSPFPPSVPPGLLQATGPPRPHSHAHRTRNDRGRHAAPPAVPIRAGPSNHAAGAIAAAC